MTIVADGARNYWLGRWAEALRSGEYLPIRELVFAASGCFCAAGVLADLFVRDGLLPEWGWYSQDGRFVQTLPVGWFDVVDAAIGYPVFYEVSERHEMGRSFAESAAYLESLMTPATVAAYPTLLAEQEMAGVK